MAGGGKRVRIGDADIGGRPPEVRGCIATPCEGERECVPRFD